MSEYLSALLKYQEILKASKARIKEAFIADYGPDAFSESGEEISTEANNFENSSTGDPQVGWSSPDGDRVYQNEDGTTYTE